MSEVRVYLVDDHPVVREGFVAVLESEPQFRVVGQAAEARTAIREIASSLPDVVLVDLTLPDMGGLELIKHLRSQHADLRMLVVSILDDEVHAWRALRSGAAGFVSKSATPAELRSAVTEASRGALVLRPHLSQRLLRDAAHGRAGDDPVLRLSDRELEVFELCGRGMSTRRIAKDLRLSPKTVESHKANIREKLSLGDGTALVRAAVLWVNRERP